jgi:hypothetical protein
LPLFLSGTLSHWFRERPQHRPRCIVPISKGGDTVELHAWYGLQVSPAPSVGQAKVLRGTE